MLKHANEYMTIVEVFYARTVEKTESMAICQLTGLSRHFLLYNCPSKSPSNLLDTRSRYSEIFNEISELLLLMWIHSNDTVRFIHERQ